MDNHINSTINKTLMECFLSSPRKTIKANTYFQAYEELLGSYRGKEITLCEVGVLDGGSLHMWREYLGPKAKIIGIEFNPEAARLVSNEFIIEVGDQRDKLFWESFFKKYGPVDIVIDDGGHWNDQQIVTAAAVIPNITPGGMLIVEDTHCSYYKWMGNPSKFSFIEYAKHLVDRVNFRYAPLDQQRPGFASKYIYSIQFYESIVALMINPSLCTINVPLSNQAAEIQNVAFGTESSSISLQDVRNPLFRILRRVPIIGSKIEAAIRTQREKLHLSEFFK